MAEALAEARKGGSLGEVPVGAVITLDGRIITRAHNEIEMLKDATAHAEILAIRRAGEELENWRLEACTLVVTLEPCPMCMGAIILSRIKSVFFGARDPQFGACGSVVDLSSQAGFPKQVEVTGGILGDESVRLLKEFFANRRKTGKSLSEV